MLKRLKLTNFTLFEKADLKLGPLNVFVGENGTGKTHILKAAYCGLSVSQKQPGPFELWTFPLRAKLMGVFRPEVVEHLIRQGTKEAHVCLHFHNAALDFDYGIQGKDDVFVEGNPTRALRPVPIFFPTRELLTLPTAFVSLYETTDLPFEETWRDTSLWLQAPLLRDPAALDIVGPLKSTVGGDIVLDERGRFQISSESGRLEVPLAAEGMRKLGMVTRLIGTGALKPGATLFWDEPESNLNPRLIKLIARTIHQLAKWGVQVFVATHSLFLLRELYILSLKDFPESKMHCFGLRLKRGGGVTIKQGNTIDEIGDVAALDEELAQSDRYLETQYIESE